MQLIQVQRGSGWLKNKPHSLTLQGQCPELLYLVLLSDKPQGRLGRTVVFIISMKCAIKAGIVAAHKDITCSNTLSINQALKTLCL